MTNKPPHILIIRLSSFGDIVQGLGVPPLLKSQLQGCRIDWLVREDFKDLLTYNPYLDEVVVLPRQIHLLRLLAFAWRLANSPYTDVYDAHNNLRSWLIRGVFFLKQCLFPLAPPTLWVRRPKSRLRRWLLMRWHLPTLPSPFRGAESFLWPLTELGLSEVNLPPAPVYFYNPQLEPGVRSKLGGLTSFIAVAPSAAWEMKRWPIAHWKKLIALLGEENFVVLGGPKDAFCQELTQQDPHRVLNLAGQLSLEESAIVLSQARLVISGDTGLLHVADQLGRPALALIGPTAFGFPARSTSKVLQIGLSCQPCSKDGRGKCRQSIYQKCLIDLTPEIVGAAAQQVLRGQA